MEEVKKCPFCAEDIKVEAVKCRFCGSNLDGKRVSNMKYKDKNTAGVLALILGGIGAHKFYLGKPIQGLFYILFVWTFIPAILGILEGLSYLLTKQEDWDNKINNIGDKPQKSNKSFRLT